MCTKSILRGEVKFYVHFKNIDKKNYGDHCDINIYRVQDEGLVKVLFHLFVCSHKS